MHFTHTRLLELCHYSLKTGIFTRKFARGKRPAGSRVGNLNRLGYWVVRVDGSPQILAHRLAWFYVHGRWPSGDLDHKNGVRDDNRIKNLREAPRSINCQNQRIAQKKNHCGLLGVCWHKRDQCWRAQITVNDKKKHLGSFTTTAKKAHHAYVKAKRELHDAGCTL